MKPIEIYRNYLKMLVGGYVNSVLCYSKAGLGKTYTTIELLNELDADYKYVSGVSTTVGLYKLLFDNNNKVIVLDDIETLFQDDKIINLLKSALWSVDGENRIVSYNSSSKTLEEYPDRFVFDGKIIILMNELKGSKDESYKALLSRTLKFELKYTFDDVKEIAHEIVNERDDVTDEQKTSINDLIDTYVKPEHNFNFRLLERLITFIKYDDENGSDLFFQSLDWDEEVAIIRQIIEKDLSVNEQVKEYMQKTGKSRMTFYRKCKKLRNEGLL